ncbi:MAG: tetratricopeptide repeat protein, partial [Thaumarchaeota archaeon]|nr:tetratricopeptide repeat protein [Nitrososphaerota archaeon]
MARRKKRGFAARSPEEESEALFRRGEALVGRGLVAEAEKVLDRAVELAPGDPAAGQARARGILAQARGDAALGPAADSAPRMDAVLDNGLDGVFAAPGAGEMWTDEPPGGAEALEHYARALLRVEEGEHEEALSELDRAVELEPQSHGAHNARGEVLSWLDRHDESLAAHGRAAEIDPEYAHAHHGRGCALASLGRH